MFISFIIFFICVFIYSYFIGVGGLKNLSYVTYRVDYYNQPSKYMVNIIYHFEFLFINYTRHRYVRTYNYVDSYKYEFNLDEHKYETFGVITLFNTVEDAISMAQLLINEYNKKVEQELAQKITKISIV